MIGPTNRRPPALRRWWALLVAATLILAVMPAVFSPVSAAEPSQVSFTLQGCREPSAASYDPDGGDLVCDDGDYTTGNLGKEWEELDLVPHRVTADAGTPAPAAQTYTVAFAADHRDGGNLAYDAMSVPVLNTAKSTPGACTFSVGPQTVASLGGGVDESMYRLMTITQPKSSTCVFDYHQRLGVGAHLFPGSNLHSNLFNESLGSGGVGQKEVPLPVKEVEPQDLEKTMAATQGSDYAWNVTKSASPTTLTFANTCGLPSSRTAEVDVTVSWTRLPASPSGAITVVTNIYATNPANRLITVNVTDKIRSGTTVLHTVSTPAAGVDVPGHTADFLVLTHTTTVPAGTTNLNDVATAAYTDKLTGIAVPGTTEATASATVQLGGGATNATAVITDTESITGSGLTFKVSSTTGASGSFDGYSPGTYTTGPVVWTSATQNGNGSVTFHKTVQVDEPMITSGTLSDTATLTGSDGFTDTAGASVSITSDAGVTLTIDKTIPNVLTGGESATFTFDVTGPGYTNTVTMTFTAGQTGTSLDLTGLAPGTYTVHERPVAGWATQPDKAVSITLPSCAGQVSFTNGFGPARAKVNKVTDPAGSEAGWQFTLTGPGTPQGGETLTTTGAGFVFFAALLQEGSYTITETPKPGWDQTAASSQCSFTVDYPGDTDRIFSCTFTNVQRGRIVVDKVTVPSGSSQVFGFTLAGGPSALSQSFGLTDAGTPHDSGLIKPGDGYAAAETVPAGWDLTSAVCSDGSSPASVSLAPGETVTCTFTNTQRGSITIVKNAVPDGPQDFAFTGDLGSFLLDDDADPALPRQRVFSGLQPGTYLVTEAAVPGWVLTGVTCNDAGSSVTGATASIDLDPGESIVCTYVNTELGSIQVVKQTSPSDSDSFGFTLTPGSGAAVAGSGGTFLWDGLGAGTYELVENLRPEQVSAGWGAPSVSCGTATVTAIPSGVQIALGPGQDVTCVFTNVQTIVLGQRIEAEVLPVTGIDAIRAAALAAALLALGALLLTLSRRREQGHLGR